MFAGHDPYLVALSVVIAILGGYTGFGLTVEVPAEAAPKGGWLRKLTGSA
jgi:NO-binding membrane sensor protein with MHYT domain